jgi:predicted transcriptional regulator of viral defense system
VRGTEDDGRDERRSSWTFLTNHAQVLFCVLQDPTVRLRDVADAVGITERAAQSIVADLVAEGYLSRTRVGRRNQYRVHTDLPLLRDDHQRLSVAGLMAFMATPRTLAYANLPASAGSNGDGHLN